MKHAFSLVELSIVLVILGLLTGGILTGQSLIRAAELRAITTEFQAYQTAANTFRDKYFALPGDITNATDFWGDAASSGGDCYAVEPTSGTCNGNGDGLIQRAHSSGSIEDFAFWQHLALAGLIEGRYNSVVDTATGWSNLGVNVPDSKFSSGGWQSKPIATEHTPHYPTILSDGLPNYLYFAKPGYYGSGSDEWSLGEILTAEEAWNIDTKVDDGIPASGAVQVPSFQRSDVVSPGANRPDCDDGTANAYDLTSIDVKCSLAFQL